VHALTEYWMQPDATTQSGTSQPGQSAPAREGGPSGIVDAGLQFVFLPLMLALMYFMLIRPQQKRQRETEALIKSLRKGDIVRTTGGIRGEITDLSETDVVLLVADKVKINVLRTAIAGKAEPAASSSASKERP